MAKSENTETRTMSRDGWISVMALSKRSDLDDIWNAIESKPDFRWIRKPEFGTVMARARADQGGSQFNFGDVSVTRCSLETADGQMGIAYVVGRDKRHAALAAILDACLQRADLKHSLFDEIAKLWEALSARRQAKLARAYATRVEFSETAEPRPNGQ
ncbi:phosphonate C-P lyase system protein PhnG [Rhizobium laguerreae]|uniref:phosphonate C-P lyase system protein PhnG n=1 Tax=Rhizobium laguerreae TaxID=1076926 RepID=UPI00103D4C83|nr:phosphonate C-P lyase system protein PhnG [Rhizobium laguerreae]TBX99050.1 phosphonate C-P lyase system protein PhnG [Rhizobium laguerreae]